MEHTFDIEKYNRNEFRIVTGILAFFLLNIIATASNENAFSMEWYPSFEQRGLRFSNFENYFLPWLFRSLTLYGVYVAAHFFIIKKIVYRVDITSAVLLSILLVSILVGVWTWSAVWLQYFLFFKYETGKPLPATETYVRLLLRSLVTISWFTGSYALYNYLKYNKHIEFTVEGLKSRGTIWRDCYWAFCVWLLLAVIIQGPSILALPVIPIYAYLSLRLIPLVKAQNKGLTNYLTRVTLIAVVIALVVILMYSAVISHNVNGFSVAVIAYTTFQVFVVAPATWAIYHYRLSRNAELTGLKTALGQSSANLDFLRSQINPHFLFNALNTLYGTSIQENAERTGEGIQKLGDMMRFMLHENVQEKISLMREVDYLKNYIDLQKLRTHTSPDIVIQTEIEESVNGLQIAPMLLIPFVENAFKHGISMRESSHIKITLHTEGLKLFFDVYNSVHPKPGIDPEKNHTGIGLENVKQRLQLLYPGRHELMIRETGKEYFIHLTIEL